MLCTETSKIATKMIILVFIIFESYKIINLKTKINKCLITFIPRNQRNIKKCMSSKQYVIISNPSINQSIR